MKKLLSVLMSLMLAVTLFGCTDNNKVNDSRRQLEKAITLYENEQYEEAIEILSGLETDNWQVLDYLNISKTRILERYIESEDFATAYPYYDNEVIEFKEYARDTVSAMIRNFVNSSYENLEETDRSKFEYAYQLLASADCEKTAAGEVVRIVNENFDTIIKWQNAAKFVRYFDDELTNFMPAIEGHHLQQNYSDLSYIGLQILEDSSFYMQNDISVDEKADEAFLYYQNMGTYLESIQFKNTDAQREERYQNFMSEYKAYTQFKTQLENEYVGIYNELIKYVS